MAAMGKNVYTFKMRREEDNEEIFLRWNCGFLTWLRGESFVRKNVFPMSQWKIFLNSS